MDAIENKIANFKEMYDKAFDCAFVKASIFNIHLPSHHHLRIVEDGIDLSFEGYNRGVWEESVSISWRELAMDEETFKKHCMDEKKNKDDADKKRAIEKEAEKENQQKADYLRLKSIYDK